MAMRKRQDSVGQDIVSDKPPGYDLLSPEEQAEYDDFLAATLRNQLKEMQDRVEQEKKRLKNRIEEFQTSWNKRKNYQENECSHQTLNPNGGRTSKLVGQFVTGANNERILVLTCNNSEACGKTFSDPPQPQLGWDPIPNHLMPNMQEIGGTGRGLVEDRIAPVFAGTEIK